MYRDESETLLDIGHSHNFATAFLRNLRCSAVMSINVWACQTVKNRLNYNTRWLPTSVLDLDFSIPTHYGGLVGQHFSRGVIWGMFTLP